MTKPIQGEVKEIIEGSEAEVASVVVVSIGVYSREIVNNAP